jgi:hypothetical protein
LLAEWLCKLLPDVSRASLFDWCNLAGPLCCGSTCRWHSWWLS